MALVQPSYYHTIHQPHSLSQTGSPSPAIRSDRFDSPNQMKKCALMDSSVYARETALSAEELAEKTPPIVNGSQSPYILPQLEIAAAQCDLEAIARLLKHPITLVESEFLHTCVVSHGFEQLVSVGNSLISMYSRCNDVDSAFFAFGRIHLPDVISWTLLITAFCQHGLSAEALHLFEKMQLEGVTPDKVTHISILKACKDIEQGKIVHESIKRFGFESDVIVGTALVSMYARCHCVDDAHSIFLDMPVRNVVSWNTMITAYTEEGQQATALQLFREMQEEGTKPNRVTFLSLVATGSVLDKSKCSEIHMHTIGSGFHEDIIVQNALINMYGKLGAVKDAYFVFIRMHFRDLVSWNTIISVHAQQGHAKAAIELFQEMCGGGVNPDHVTLISILSACALLEDLKRGKEIHILIIKAEGTLGNVHASRVLGTALVNMYGKCGALQDARAVFDSLSHRDVIAWTSMIGAYERQGKGKEALEIFGQMQCQGVKPNSVTFVVILTAYASLLTTIDKSKMLEEVKIIHGSICDNGLDSDVMVGNALINIYGKCGAIDDALSVFGTLRNHDVVSWTCMITAYFQQGYGEESLQLFKTMWQEGLRPDIITFSYILSVCSGMEALEEGQKVHNCIVLEGLEIDVAAGNALLSMYGKCGALREARFLLDGMQVRDVISWNSMITYCVEHGLDQEAFDLCIEMQYEGVKPNEVTFVSLLSSCADTAAFMVGQMLHSCIKDNGLESDTILGNALINMYGKCGAVELAWATFNSMLACNEYSWSALIAAYAQYGYAEKAIKLFNQMLGEGLEPDSVTFVSLLSACSHGGRLKEGIMCFASMWVDHGMMPMVEHYVCMIDLLGRAGGLDEAEHLVTKVGAKYDSSFWPALLGACKLHGDVERGKCCAAHMLDSASSSPMTYVLLSNLFSADE